MEVNKTLEEILEIIKFTLTDQQKDAIKQKLDKLYNSGIGKGYWSSGQGID